MIEINVEFPNDFGSKIPKQLERAVQLSVSNTLMAAKSRWESIAQKKLTTTRADYLLGLNADNSVNFPDPFTGVLTLRGKWPNMLEKGFSSFDMKENYKNSPRAKKKKDGGWYLTVPFRHRTPGSTGSAVGGAEMPEDIYARARLLRAGKTLRGTEQTHPARSSWTGYQHKSGIYENMVKNRKTYERATQSTYFTFRRMSNKSDPRSWWHPGFRGIHAADLVAPWVRDTFQRVLADNLKNLG